MNKILPFINPIQWIKAGNFARKNKRFDKSSYDLELYLYSQILSNDMLHYGYFENPHTPPETISLKDIEDAQLSYANLLLEKVIDKQSPVLDIGCGMGGLSNMISIQNDKVESLTPNKNQIHFIRKRFPQLTTHNYKYENFKTKHKYGTIINSESLQYIDLDQAIAKSNSIIKENGRWIICDYFSNEKKGNNQKPHHLETFLKKAKSNGWTIATKTDITANILPTMAYVDMLANRFLIPFKHFAYEKLRFKKPHLFFLTEKIRSGFDKKITH